MELEKVVAECEADQRALLIYHFSDASGPIMDTSNTGHVYIVLTEVSVRIFQAIQS